MKLRIELLNDGFELLNQRGRVCQCALEGVVALRGCYQPQASEFMNRALHRAGRGDEATSAVPCRVVYHDLEA